MTPPTAPHRTPRAARRAGLLLALCALGLAVGTPRPAAAQEEESGTDAAAQLPLRGFTDNDGVFKVQLPTEWKLFKDLNMTNKLGAWFGPMYPHDEKRATTMFAVQVNPSFRRAALAGSANGTAKLLSEETRKGKGFLEVCVQPEKGNKFEWHRHVEAHGQLYTVIVATVHDDLELARPVVRKWLDTFKLAKAPKPESLPEEWSEKKVKGIEVASDSDDKKEIERAVEAVNLAADMLKKVLPGKPFDTAPLRMKFFANGGDFNRATSKDFGREEDFSAFHYGQNAVYVKAISGGDSRYEEYLYRAGADATIQRHFGGRIPQWLHAALLHYAEFAARSGGKPKKLDSSIIDTVKPAAQTCRQLDTWFDLDFARSGDTNKSRLEVFAWVWFLNHGKAPKSASKAFEEYLEILHKTGDETAARKAWAEVDFPKLHEEMKEFASDWR